MRSVGVARVGALVASAIAMALPYNAWLGAATVPEGWTGAVTAAALVAMTQASARPWCAAAMLAASLSRYEAWPAVGVFALYCGLQARRGPAPGRDIAWALLAAAGPIAWMAWNAHAHGSALHFIARVTRFRQAVGAADMPLGEKLLGYPRALVVNAPEAAVLGLAGVFGMGVDATLRARWGWSAAAAAAVLLFLIAGDLGDGAPTHHPARALCATWWIGVAMGIDAATTRIARIRSPWRTAAVVSAGAFAAAWAVALSWRLRAAPGESDAERRDSQIERGLSMRARGVASAEITPCAFEHFALLAAWGAPEQATVNARTGEAITAACPRVEEH
jgi:hypothetical protein